MDHVPKQVRSRIMASVKSRGNRSTEQAVAAVLRQAGLVGYRRQWPIAGKPDFAWPGLRVALFVDGCFWHGCPTCNRPSKSNVSFWKRKVSDNQRRDKRVTRWLRRHGWSVLRVWECKVGAFATRARIQRVIEGRKASLTKKGHAKTRKTRA
ncbi:MAG: very short patch repair endonuclease [Bryobacteraceae bacterium]|jgi:DNA mismatch endonuclease (patch repair protein)